MMKQVVDSGLRKIAPRAKLPADAVLGALSAADGRLVRRRLTEPVECVYDACFAEPGIEQALIGSLRGPARQPRCGSAADDNDDSGVDLLRANKGRSLTTEQEQHLFRWLNYCRYRVMQVIEGQAGRRLSAKALAEFLRWERAAAGVREELVRMNVPLVLAMAKRTRITGVDFADLVSEGSMALLRSVDKFDCARGYKFSTYACRAILKSFSRVATRAARYRGHFPTEFDPTLEKSDRLEKKRLTVEDDCVDELRCALGGNSANLSEVERQVIKARFSLDESAAHDGSSNGKTLEEVGVMIGVTKERVRQIQNKALGKLRHYLDGGVLAV